MKGNSLKLIIKMLGLSVVSILSIVIVPGSSAADLGPADLDFEAIQDQLVFDKDVMCTKLHLDLRKFCKVEFREGRLIVDASRGIIPSQVRHLSWSEETFYTNAKRFEIIYESSEGTLMRAEINMSNGRQAERFYKSLLLWMSKKQ